MHRLGLDFRGGFLALRGGPDTVEFERCGRERVRDGHRPRQGFGAFDGKFGRGTRIALQRLRQADAQQIARGIGFGNLPGREDLAPRLIGHGRVAHDLDVGLLLALEHRAPGIGRQNAELKAVFERLARHLQQAIRRGERQAARGGRLVF